MIKVENLSKHFGNVKAVDDISFEVAEHENLILLGTSGCGKTTTLKMLNRLIEPSHGKIFIDGKNILEQSARGVAAGHRLCAAKQWPVSALYCCRKYCHRSAVA